MGTWLEQISTDSLLLVAALWLVVIGIASTLYLIFEQYRRKRRLRLLGLREQQEGKTKKNTLKEWLNTLAQLFAASRHEIEEKFVAAGIYDTKYAYLFLPLKYVFLCIGIVAIIALGVYFSTPIRTYLIWGAVWLVIIIIFPDAYLSIRSKALQKKLSDRLPYLLDLMGVCVQTGMTIESSFSYLAQEMLGFDKDIAYMLKRTNDRANIVGLEQAVEELYDRVPTPEFRSFVMTLNQSLQYGSSIYTVLTTLAVDIREVQMLNLEEKIGKLAAKMSVPLILFIMLPIVILITAPGVMRMMG